MIWLVFNISLLDQFLVAKNYVWQSLHNWQCFEMGKVLYFFAVALHSNDFNKMKRRESVIRHGHPESTDFKLGFSVFIPRLSVRISTITGAGF